MTTWVPGLGSRVEVAGEPVGEYKNTFSRATVKSIQGGQALVQYLEVRSRCRCYRQQGPPAKAPTCKARTRTAWPPVLLVHLAVCLLALPLQFVKENGEPLTESVAASRVRPIPPQSTQRESVDLYEVRTHCQRVALQPQGRARAFRQGRSLARCSRANLPTPVHLPTGFSSLFASLHRRSARRSRSFTRTSGGVALSRK